MSIETELQQALDTIDSMEQHTADAYAALQRNGASLPEKCNLANLAGVVEKGVGPYAGQSVVFESDTTTVSIPLAIKAGNQNAAQYIGAGSYSNRAKSAVYIPTTIYSDGWREPLSIEKSFIKTAYLDFGGNPAESYSYLLSSSVDGSSPTAGAYEHLEKVVIKGTDSLPEYCLCYSFSKSVDGELDLQEGLERIGKRFMENSELKGSIRLPASLVSIASPFCMDCDNITEIYIPENCPPPSGASATSGDLATTYIYAPSYVNGIVLKGPGAKVWKQALPNKTTSRYRKLILDPEWA